MSRNNAATFEPAHAFLYSPASLPSPRVGEGASAYDITAAYLEHPFNDHQRVAYEDSFNRRLSLVWGPPGTGKTTVIAAAVCGWLELAAKSKKPCAVCVGGANYNAIDRVLSEVLDLVHRRSQVTRDGPLAQVWRIRSESREAAEDPRVHDIVTREADALADLLGGPSGLTVVGGTFQQLQKLAKRYNSRFAGEDLPGVRWFDLLVLDEASQVPVASAAAYFLLLKEQGHIILAGDHKQLGPVYKFEMPETHAGLLDCVFTYMQDTHGLRPIALNVNYRTNELIASWPALRFYREGGYVAEHPRRRLALEMPNSVDAPLDWPAALPWSSAYADILNPDKPVTVVTYDDETCTLSNEFEAYTAAALSHLYYRALKRQEPGITLREFWTKRLGLVTPHRAQMATIRNLLGNLASDDNSLQLFVDTVNRFQGQERDLVVASYVVSDKDFIAAEETFILDPRRFNVTLTRARMKFVLLMSRSLLDHLPSERLAADAAANVQLFVEAHCKRFGRRTLPAGLGGHDKAVDVLGLEFAA